MVPRVVPDGRPVSHIDKAQLMLGWQTEAGFS